MSDPTEAAPGPLTQTGPRARPRRLLNGGRDSTLVQMGRYLVVAIIAFVVDFGSLYLCTDHLGIHYLISAAIGFGFGAVTNYTLSVKWVFTERKLADWRAEATIFVIIGLVGLGLNELIMWFVTEIVGVHYLISKLLSTGMVFFFNFFLRKILLFSKKSST